MSGTNYWLQQPTWFIDPVSGNDEGSGVDLAHAIKTHGELARRWGMRRGKARINQPTTITISSSLLAGDVASYGVELGPAGSLNVVGTPVLGTAGTFTNVAAINRATPIMQTVTDSGLSGGWASHVNQFMYIPSGTRAGYGAWVARDLTGGTARTTRWAKRGTTAITPLTSAPVIADPYQLVTFPTIVVDEVRVSGFDQSTSQLVMAFSGLNIDSQGTTTRTMLGGSIRSMILFSGCYLNNSHFGGGALAILVGCRLNSSASITTESGTTTRVYASLINQALFVSPGAFLQIGLDTLIQSLPHGMNIELGGVVEAGTLCSFDSTVDPIMIQGYMKTDVVQGDTAGLLWGANNVGEVSVTSLGSLEYTVKPTINAGAGIGNEVRVGGASVTWADVPLSNPANGAMVALKAL